ncbi:hypothetical protein PQQ51_08905 [Paraburkholderia xenovorans]|uniref:hypothetical protein n=1 Tax=Paraburkholderia xenovorans TaxID=36873 RepID=UPI0038BB67ED
MFLLPFDAACRHLRLHLRHFAAASFAVTVASVLLNGCSVTFPTPAPPAAAASLINGGHDGMLIPLHVERVDEGHARVGLPVQLDGRAVYLAMDTGTQGIRVLKSVLPGSNYASGGAAPSFALANGAEILGASAKLPFSVAGTQPEPIIVQAVDTVRCLPNARRCVGMDGYTGEFGWAFSGIFGIGAAPPNDTCCTQPLRALPGHIGERYLVHANVDKPYLLLSPSGALTKNYTMVPLTAAPDGAAQWPRGCVNVGNKMTFCAPLVFATGSSGMIRIEMDKAPNWTADNDEGSVLNQGNYETAIGVGSWVHRYENAQVTIVKAKPDANRIVIGLMGMQNIDVLFDFQRAQLGLFAAKQSEQFAP